MAISSCTFEEDEAVWCTRKLLLFDELVLEELEVGMRMFIYRVQLLAF